MKILILVLLSFALISSARLHGQSSTTISPTSTPAAAAAAAREEATGTITDITPGQSLVLHTGTNAGEPAVFRFGPEVTYVDSDGKTVEAAGLRKNLRVRVSYVKTGGDNIVDKVTILQ